MAWMHSCTCLVVLRTRAGHVSDEESDTIQFSFYGGANSTFFFSGILLNFKIPSRNCMGSSPIRHWRIYIRVVKPSQLLARSTVDSIAQDQLKFLHKLKLEAKLKVYY
jgi:hypothetical protein